MKSKLWLFVFALALIFGIPFLTRSQTAVSFYTVLHDNGACVRPTLFILGSDSREPLKIEHEDVAWEGEQIERLVGQS